MTAAPAQVAHFHDPEEFPWYAGKVFRIMVARLAGRAGIGY